MNLLMNVKDNKPTADSFKSYTNNEIAWFIDRSTFCSPFKKERRKKEIKGKMKE